MKRRTKWAPSARFHLLEALRALERLERQGQRHENHRLAKSHLEEAIARLEAVKNRKTRIEGASVMINQTDLPAELGSYSDGVSDDAAFHPELIGCSCAPTVSGGLSELAVGALPTYLFSRRGLSNVTVRRRVASALKAMTPKMRRRAIARLRAAAAVARVSGEIRSAYPSVAGNVGWSGVTVGASVGRCPFASVAGVLTP